MLPSSHPHTPLDVERSEQHPVPDCGPGIGRVGGEMVNQFFPDPLPQAIPRSLDRVNRRDTGPRSTSRAARRGQGRVIDGRELDRHHRGM